MFKIKFTAMIAALLLLPFAAFPQTSQEKAGKQPEKGEVFPIFEGTTYDGKKISLEDYRGKLTLIDFWATWCSPCLVELPNVRKTYADFHQKGFDILAVSLDNNAQSLKRFYENQETHLPWPSIFDGKGWESEYARRFGIQAIPATFLLDKEGTVIATNLRGKNLYNAVAERLAPEMVKPTVESLFAQYKKAVGEEKTALEQQLLELSKEDHMESLMQAAVYLMENPDPDQETAALLKKMLEPSVEQENPAAMNLAALAAYQAGQPHEARKIQNKLITSIHDELKAYYGDQYEMALNQVLQNPNYVDMTIRLSLYEASCGNYAAAREHIERIKSNPQAKNTLANNPWYQTYQEEMAKAPGEES